MKKQNYLDKKPRIKSGLLWYKDRHGAVTLKIENKGALNTLCRKFLKKPKISYIHLDKLGSFVWLQLDGTKDVYEIGKRTSKRFGDSAKPLYERLVEYFRILESYKFIEWVK